MRIDIDRRGIALAGSVSDLKSKRFAAFCSTCMQKMVLTFVAVIKTIF